MQQTILLVEDEPIISLAESMTLARFGYQVRTAKSGEAAVAAVLQDGKAIDLILMDIDLGGGMDGTEAARSILSTRNLPIVFLTSHSEMVTVDKVRGITRYGYVIKNSGDFVLQSSIEMAFELFRAHEKLRAGEARLATLLKAIPDLVWLKDTEGVYLACNPAFERFFGAPESAILGRTDYDFLTREQADFFRGKDLEAIAHGSPHSNEEWITYADDGHRAFLETIKTPLVDDQGRLVGVLGIGRDITDRKSILDRLTESEARIQQKLKAIVEPEVELERLSLAEIIDIAPLRKLMEEFSALTGMVTAVLDTKGEVILATGWQDICTRFHRAQPDSAAACTESDTILSGDVKSGDYLEYRCKNGLWDVVTPLYVDSRHLGNVFSGQYFHEDDIVDEPAFAAQAERFGFDREAYIAALRLVPRFSKERIGLLMEFLVGLTKFVSKLSYSNLQLARAMAERQRTEQLLSSTAAEKEILFSELQQRAKGSLKDQERPGTRD
jgi:PAS domain S-box-containing protein